MPGYRVAVLFLALTSLPGLTSGYLVYQTRIPNGDNVPHPCKPNYLWEGVGYINPLGGGPRNPFGVDFASKGRTWNQALCLADSDGDGRTNGEELGDPECQWSEGQIPPLTSGITHPGVCEPLGSPKCKQKNTWVTCDQEFDCPATKAPDVFNVTLRFPHTKVPAEETSYFCQAFNLPEDQDYHLVAIQPLINNTQVMQHMLLFGCDQRQTASDTPSSCLMVSEDCSSIIGDWTVGSAGKCLPDNMEVLVGQSGFKSVVLVFFWNNPEKRDDYYDSSAVVVHLAASKREQNECNLDRFLDEAAGEMLPFFYEVMTKCNAWGSCRSECRAAVRNFRQHPCSHGDVVNMALVKFAERYPRVMEFITRALTCPEEFYAGWW